MTLGALVVLMLVTVGASKVSLPGFWIFSGVAVNNIVAMIIATIKATLVVLIFMGVIHGTKLIKLWAMLGFIWMFFMVGILVDYFARPVEQQLGWEKTADGAMPRVRPIQKEDDPLPAENLLNVRPRQ